MAIIYTYPTKATPNDNDLILISDSEDSNKTKQVKISTLPGGSDSGVSSVTATLPVVSSGGGTPAISLKDLTGFGTAGQVIKVNSGADGLEWGAAGGSTLPGGSDHSVQYKNGSAFAGGNDLTFHPTNNIFSVKHTVIVKGQGNGNPAGRLKLNCEQDSHAITLEGPAHGGSDYTLKFPSAAPTDNQILQYTTSGNLGWAAGALGSSNQTLAADRSIDMAGFDLTLTNNTAVRLFEFEHNTNKLTVGNSVQDKKGTVKIEGQSGVNRGGILEMGAGGGSNYVQVKGPDTLASNYDLTLPSTAPSNTQILQSDNTGQLSWVATPSGGTDTNIANSQLQLSDNRTLDFYDGTTSVKSLSFIRTDGGSKNMFTFEADGGTSPTFKVGNTESTYEGYVVIEGNGSNRTGQLKFENAAGTYSTAIKATTTQAADITYTLPATQGAAGTFLQNDGAGVLSWDQAASYEEGTWTPVMFQSSSPSVTATGYYIKIGKKVTAFFTLVCTAGGSAEISNARISGLPFNAYSANGYKAGVSIAENTANAANQKYIAGAPGGATTLDLKVFPSSGTDYQYAQGRWPNSQGNFTVSGSYTYHAQS